MLTTKLCSLLLCATCFTSCATPSTSTPDSNATTTDTASIQLSRSDLFSEKDLEVGYDSAGCTLLTLQDNASSVSGAGATISGNTVTITTAGTYLLQGALTNGQIVIAAEKTDDIRLILNGVTLTNASSAALYVKQADKVTLTLSENSKNALSTTGAFLAIDDNSIDAALYSQDDLTLNGAGALSVTCSAGNGITCKDDLSFTGGQYTIQASGHSLEGKDSIRIADGTFRLTAGKDGLHSDNTEDSEKGFVYLGGGTLQIKAEGDGIEAASLLQIDDGTLTVTSTDDTLHSNGDFLMNNGTLTLSSGDDGIHADRNVSICKGSISITNSYEGIEGQSIDLSGGTIQLAATDDGLNAAGGTDTSTTGRKDTFAADEKAYIHISGGTLSIDAGGDGIDSNGSFAVSGGTTTVSGPTNNGNGALDYNGTASISGGILLAAGSSGMAQNFGADSTQASMLVSTQAMQTGAVVLTDSSGQELFRATPTKSYNSVVLSLPGLQTGSTYSLTMGTETQSITLSSLIYGTGGMGGMGGMPGGGMGGGTRPQDGTMPNGERPQKPSETAPARPDGTQTGDAVTGATPQTNSSTTTS